MCRYAHLSIVIARLTIAVAISTKQFVIARLAKAVAISTLFPIVIAKLAKAVAISTYITGGIIFV